MTAAYGHGVTAAILGKTLAAALTSWRERRGPVMGSPGAEAEDVAAGWYCRMHCTHRPASMFHKEWLPR